jgi:hypothetical protein
LQDAKKWYEGSSNFQFPKATDVLGDWKDEPEAHLTLAMFGLSVKRKQCDSSTTTEPEQVCEPEFRAPPFKKVRFEIPYNEFREWEMRIKAQNTPPKRNWRIETAMPRSKWLSSYERRYGPQYNPEIVNMICNAGEYCYVHRPKTTIEVRKGLKAVTLEARRAQNRTLVVLGDQATASKTPQ